MKLSNDGGNETRPNSRVALALSGGVDSAVAAILLQKSGFDVSGFFMKTYEPSTGSVGDCPWKEDQEMAHRVARHLNIPFATWNFEREYEHDVLKPFRDGLTHNQTPNPDVACNSQIKFGAFLKKATSEGFEYIATGHYVQSTFTTNSHAPTLRRGADPGKDQSYFLCRVNRMQLSKALFPVGHLLKKDVRRIARHARLPNADRQDSQGICFIGSVDMNHFIESLIPKKPGDIVDEKGVKKGMHNGLHFYTIGQRYGIGIGGKGSAWYVAQKDASTNSLVVVQGNDHPLLYRKTLFARDVRLIDVSAQTPRECLVQIRYRQTPVPTTIEKESDGRLKLTFAEPQRAPTPGQVVAFYLKDICLGGAIISDCEMSDSSL